MIALDRERVDRPGALQQSNTDHRRLAGGAGRRQGLPVGNRIRPFFDGVDVRLDPLDVPEPFTAAVGVAE